MRELTERRFLRAATRGRPLAGAIFAVTALLGTAGWAQAQSADLVLAQQVVSPDPVPAGGVATITMTLQNNGPDAASGVKLGDTIPPGSTFVSLGASDGGTCTSVAPYECTWAASVPFQASRTVTLQVILPAAGVWPNSASVSATTADPNGSNNSLSRNITAVAAADLRITASHNAAPGAVAGTPYSYTLNVSNGGPNALPSGQSATVTFNVPAGATITGVPTGSGWSCSPSGGYPLSNPPSPGALITCTRTDGLASGSSYPPITVPAMGNVNGTVSASFGVGSTYPDGDLANNTGLVDVPFTAGTDMALTKTASPTGTVAVGAPVTFTLQAQRRGGVNPSNVVVTDTLPAGLTYVSHAAPAPWSCSFSAPTLTCTYAGTYTGAPYTNLPAITLTATVGLGPISNTATVALPTGQTDPVPGNNTGSVSVTGSNDADLSVNKTATISPVVPNQDYNWTITVRNNGPVAVAPGQTVTVTENIPAGMRLNALPTGTGWTCSSSGGGAFPQNGPVTVTCTRSDGRPASSNFPSITVPVRHTGTGTLNNNVCVNLTGAGPVDNNPNNNCVTRGNASTATQADLSISKTATPEPVVVGQNVTYTLTVRNAGPDASTNVTLTDNLANLITAGGLQSIVASQGSCTPATTPANGPTQNVSCNLGTLSSGASATVTIVARLANTTASDRTHTNTASVTSPDVGDPNRSNNSASVNSTVQPRVDVTVSKSVTPNPVRVGEPLVYVITARNNGPSTATNVTITDALPANTAMLGTATATNAGTCTAPADGAISGSVACSWASIPSGTQYTATFRVRPLAAALGTTIHNVVNIATDSTETDTNNNSATADATVIAADLDVLVHKTDDVDPVVLGADTEYTITVTNVGPSYGTNLLITDTFPKAGTTPSARFSYQGSLSASIGGTPVAAPTCTEPAVGAISGTLTCSFPTIAIGASNAIVIKYRMRAESIVTAGDYGGTQRNNVVVAVAETEREMDNNETDEDTTTRREAIATDLSLTKSINKQTLAAGEQAVFSLTVTNHGPLDSLGAQVVDPLPAGMSFVSSVDGCVASGSTVSCAVGALASGASRTFTFTVQLDDPYNGSSPITNTATLDAPGDTNPANNTGTARVRVPSREAVAPIPTLGEWAMVMLMATLAGLGATRLRRRT